MQNRRFDCLIVVLTSVAGVVACSAAPDHAQLPVADASALADEYYAWLLERAPEEAYFSGVEIERHNGLFDNRPEALQEAHRFEDTFAEKLRSVDATGLEGTADWITLAYLRQHVNASIAQRICRYELWNVNQMGGWHLAYTQIAELQPVGTPELRDQAMRRWIRFPVFIDQEITNLEAGLAKGYSSPRSVVARVIDQLNGLLELPVDQSPFASAALRDTDESFAAELHGLVETGIYPALHRYRDFLQDTYLDAARAELSVTANPDGAACYEASLRAYTTVDRSGQEVFELGQETVEANAQTVIELGLAAYGIEDFAQIIERAKADPADRFANKEELLQFSEQAVKRAATAMPDWVLHMPAQPVSVVPFAEHEEGTGRSAHYRPGNENRAAEYRIPLHRPEEQSRGNAEATAFHETWPGHHLQVASAQAIEGLHPVTRIIWFSGPGEGWARYSEALAEEMGLYETVSGPILRRAWPARGMVVDPGIHLHGWTREQAIEFMVVSGRFERDRADEMVDRIAILPGQLTAYDSGGLEILALRREAGEALGEDFDIREFHDEVLENGTIPLTFLRQHIEQWIEESRAQPVQ
ncbi:MAG: DUF885 domain-containing protein [Woeseiaceae bacterium]|nr:DUF885 domain-containing protein [Woeseiaceae bacterium]